MRDRVLCTENLLVFAYHKRLIVRGDNLWLIVGSNNTCLRAML